MGPQRVPQQGPKYETIIQLFKSGLTINEIAERVYGEDNYRNRQKVHYIIYHYGKRLGLLKGNIVYDRSRGEFVESQSGLVVDREVRADFVEHSYPVPPQTPFLGGYSNVVQLKASLSRKDMTTYRVLEWVDKFLALLDGVNHDSIVRQSAALLARGNSSLVKKYGVKVVAASCIVVSLAYNAPTRVEEFLNLIRELHRLSRNELLSVIFNDDFWLPSHMALILAKKFVLQCFKT